MSVVCSKPCNPTLTSSSSSSLYYEFKYRNLPLCTNPIHALLHVADCIEEQGPLCNYWCFSMERTCGAIKRKAQRNRTNAITALSNSIAIREQVRPVFRIAQVQKLKSISFSRTDAKCGGFPARPFSSATLYGQ